MNNWNDFESDEWLIDLLEGESDPSMQKDLELLLKRSRAQKSLLDDYETLRDLIAASEAGSREVPAQGDRYFEDLHAKIMKEIPEVGAPRHAKAGSRTFLKAKRNVILISVASLGLAALAITLWMQSSASLMAQKENDFSQHLIASASVSRALRTSVLDRDLLTGAATLKLEELDEAQTRKVLGQLTL